MYYLIKETLEPCGKENLFQPEVPFLAVVSSGEWEKQRSDFGIEIDMDMDVTAPPETKAVVNRDALTGTFFRPKLSETDDFEGSFSFVLDDRGIVLIDDSGYAEKLVSRISGKKKSRFPSLERFIYDLLETAIAGDLPMMEKIEKRLNLLEESIMQGSVTGFPSELNSIRGDLLDLRVHYEQMIDLGQELEENENDFFAEENLRYFHMFTERVIRLQDIVSGEREYVTQLRDLLQAQLEVRQNTIMTVLTVITSIFLPLTLIAGWYGMNFVHMPELNWAYGYPVVIIISAVIVALCLWWFKRKKWM